MSETVPCPACGASPSGRRPLSSRRKGYTQKLRLGEHKFYVHTGEYDDGTLGEVFIDAAKHGAFTNAILNSLAIVISLGLQHGTPLEEYVEAFCFSKFEPNGVVQGHDRLKTSTSLMDLIVRDLAIHYLDRDDLAHTGGGDTEVLE